MRESGNRHYLFSMVEQIYYLIQISCILVSTAPKEVVSLKVSKNKKKKLKKKAKKNQELMEQQLKHLESLSIEDQVKYFWYILMFIIF